MTPARVKPTPCVVAGCPRYQWVRGLCKAHYDRYRRTGNPNGVTGAPVMPPGYVRPPKPPAPHPDWGYGLPGNPWAGHERCPACGSHRWTMPTDGRWQTARWVCIAPAHPSGSHVFKRRSRAA